MPMGDPPSKPRTDPATDVHAAGESPAQADAASACDAGAEDIPPKLAARIAAVTALADDVEAAAARLHAGRTDCIAADASAISARVTALEEAVAGEALEDTARAALQAPLARLDAALSTHQALVDALRTAAAALVAQAKREQRKRAGGGLYSAEGAAAYASNAGGRVLGRL